MLSSSLETLIQTASSPPSCSRSRRWKDSLLAASYFKERLDRVNVLGGDSYGHTGCVNALSWARGGEVLISGGDDTTIRLWRMDRSNTEDAYPFTCDTIIQTGHRGNVFNAQMLPHSSCIATVAGDGTVRVFDHTRAAGYPRHTGETEYGFQEANTRVLRCHSGRTKRIVTEDSPHSFLTVAEDGTVRQHDLRVRHSCRGGCPAPLVHVEHSLYTLSMSPLTPYQFVVAGSSPFGYLFDRRHAGRHFQEEWGQPPDSNGVTTCVRKFGRRTRGQFERKDNAHVTGSRMASSNGHEVLLSYSSDAIYLYSTRDDPEPTSIASRESSILPPNKRRKHRQDSPGFGSGSIATTPHNELTEEEADRDAMMEEDIERISAESSPSPNRERLDDLMNVDDEDDRPEDGDEEEEYEEDEESQGDQRYKEVPTIMPRSRYDGVCNVETVKDVNFLGPRDEFVVSGSDDGNWFMWEKDTGRLHDILEGDGAVVNVIEGHPYLPLVAVSGIDHTVKLFAPTSGPSRFSKLDRAQSIIDRNIEATRPQHDLTSMLLYRLARQMADNQNGELAECNHQ
ncbi:WD40 repeat-like protein [Earliella scabrosa]|nr:WD40 repeat-like protein [Earliella scabrosa]